MCCDQVIKKNWQKVQNKAHFWLATAITFHPEIVLHFLSLLCTESWKCGKVYHHKLPKNTNTYQRMLQTLLFLSLQGSKPTTGTFGYSFVTLFPFIHPFSSVYPIRVGWSQSQLHKGKRGGTDMGAPWTGCQSDPVLTQRQRQPFPHTFTPIGKNQKLTHPTDCISLNSGTKSKCVGITRKPHTERPRLNGGVELKTFVLRCSSANHRAIMLPISMLPYCIFLLWTLAKPP